jgi:uncharacterized protein (TIGR03086 family)
MATFGAHNRTMDTRTTPAPLALDFDPRPLFSAAAATASVVIGAVRPDQLDGKTPCSEYDVRQLLGHLVSVLPRVAAMGRGSDPMSVGGDPGEVADDAWLPTWLAAVDDVQAAWRDDAALERKIVLPWATDTGAAALLGYVSEITVHTWDVARATGQEPAWNDDVLRNALDLMQSWLPGENRAEMYAAVHAKMGPEAANYGDPFAEVVPVPDDAALIDRLVAWNGRRP